ncbi:MAG: aspartate kinase [Bacteroidetes bacterium]|nr:aspartate kinase [Bacteroidota bacterium]MCW5897337.1 aspartate kinase [Bacteroidota bacterium]
MFDSFTLFSLNIMIVMKFGGTSNEDAAAMRNVIRLVKSHLDKQPVVVISAIAKATNELELTARTAALGKEDEAVAIVTRLFERHNKIIDNLLASRSAAAELEGIFFNHLAEIKALVKGIAILRELTPRTLDAMCSFGERLSSRIIAAGLLESGVQSVWVDAKEFMLTDDNFGRAQPVFSAVEAGLEKKVRPLLEQRKVPVTQGFIGITRSGEYTTMGRESSDYSASIIGWAMNAANVQIWTDVDGILTADPRVVKSVKKLKRLSFEEAFELSYFGAKVLHPRTMLPVIEKNIPVQILNSKREGTGTVVDYHLKGSEEQPGAVCIKSIAHKDDIAVVSIFPLKRFSPYMFWEEIFSVLTAYGITTGMTATSEFKIAFAIDDAAVSDGLAHELEKFGRVEILHNKGSLCLVGKGIRGAGGILPRIFHALPDFQVYMISFGASDANLTLVIDGERLHEALNNLHAGFFERDTLPDTFEEVAH